MQFGTPSVLLSGTKLCCSQLHGEKQQTGGEALFPLRPRRLMFVCLLILGCAGSLLLRGLFSSCGEQGRLSSSGACSIAVAFLLQSTRFRCVGFSSCGTGAQ